MDPAAAELISAIRLIIRRSGPSPCGTAAASAASADLGHVSGLPVSGSPDAGAVVGEHSLEASTTTSSGMVSSRRRPANLDATCSKLPAEAGLIRGEDPMSHLNPYEENLLRAIEQQISEDDARLARRLRTLRPPVLERLAPPRWQPCVFFTIGIVLVTLGLLLEVGSSFVGGLVSLILAWLRSLQGSQPSPTPNPDGRHGTPFSHR